MKKKKKLTPKINIDELKIKILNKSQFLGQLLFNIDIKVSLKIDTLAVYFNDKKMQFVMLINPFFFNKLTEKEKIAVVEHELYHIYFRHFERDKTIKNINMEVANIAMDISINQYIENLPKNALYPETYNLPKNLNFEEYYDLLKDKFPNENNNNTNNNNDNNNNDSYDNSNKQKTNENNKNCPLDNHKWFEKIYKEKEENNNDDKNNNIDQEIFENYIKNLFKDVLDKVEQHSKQFDEINDIDKFFKNEIEDFLNKLKQDKNLNIKYLIKLWIEKIILSNFFKTSWKYPNRRFEEAKGKKRIKKRKFAIAIDTSGSINEEELEYFINIIYNTLDKLYDEVLLLFFTTNVYFNIKIDKKFDVKKVLTELKSGGTDIQKVFDFLKKQKFKHLIILTDGETRYPLKTYNIKSIWIYNNLEELVKKRKFYITNGFVVKNNVFNNTDIDK